jgi:methionyl-tRNA formyltransferase
MTKTSPTIIFFGSGPVAAASLRFLEQHFNVEAVITKASTKAEMFAAAPNVPQHLINNRVELTAFIATKPFASRIGVIVDYGVIVDQVVIDYFPLGIINSHFSLLPEWRGADPITFSILSGQKQTGVSLMRIVAGLDEGDLLTEATQDIPPKATTPELTNALIDLSNTLLREFLPLYIAGDLIPYVQPADQPATYSRKLTKDDGILDWQKPAVQLEREVRAYADWPKSRTTLAGKDVVITKAQVVATSGKPGDVQTEGKNLIVVTSDQGLQIDELKPAGKQAMSAEGFLAGYRDKL